MLHVRCSEPLAPVHRCARSVCCVACAVSWATWLLFTGLPARCVVLCVRCLGPLGSRSPVCPFAVLCCVYGVLGPVAPVHRCARSLFCVACAVSWATWLLFTSVPARCDVLHGRCPEPWLLFTGVPAWCVVMCVRCPGPLGSCSPCARSVCCAVCAVSWATWLLFTGVPVPSCALLVRCPGPRGSYSGVCPLRALLCVCGVLGPLAPVHRCVCSVCVVACVVSWATWLLTTGLPAQCVVLPVRCPGPLGSWSLVCPLGVLCCVYGVLGPLAPVHRCACSVFCVACVVSRDTWLLFTSVPARVLCCVYGVLGHLASVHQFAHSVCCVACTVSWAPWLLFTGVPARCFVLRVRCAGPLGSCSPACLLGVLCCVCGVLCHLAPVHPCACSVCCAACAVSWATWLLFTGVPVRCGVMDVRCPGAPGACLPVRPLCPLLCLCGVLGHLPPVHRCSRSVCCFACAVSWATWLPFTGVPAWCVVLRLRCPGPLASGSPVCPLVESRCMCGVLGHLAPVHRCARSVFCVACVVSWDTRHLFTSVPARCVVSRVVYSVPLGSCSPACSLGVLCCVYGVLGHLAPVHQFAHSMCCVACTVSWAPWLLFTGVPAPCFVLRVRCPGPLGSCSPVRPLGVLCCVCGFLGHLAPVHQCARWVCWVACAVSWATWLLFRCVPAPCVALPVWCPGPLGSHSPVSPLGVLCCVYGVLGPLAPVQRCARSVCCVACAVSRASWLLTTSLPAPCVVLRVRCPGPVGSCSPVCPLGVLRCVYGVLGPLAPVHRCVRSVCGVACVVSLATWRLFSSVPARCVVSRVQFPVPLGSCSPVCPLGVLCCVYGVPGHLAPVHQFAHSVCCVACAVSCATWLLFTGVPARCVVLCVRCPEPLGSCSPVGLLDVLCCVCGVLGHLAPVHRCARSVWCGACAVSWGTWLLLTSAPAPSFALLVRCPGPLALCSPVCPLGVLFCVCSVLGRLAPVYQCARSVCCVASAESWATSLLFSSVPARCVFLLVRCPRPVGSCSPVCPLSVLCCVCGVLGHLAPAH